MKKKSLKGLIFFLSLSVSVAVWADSPFHDFSFEEGQGGTTRDRMSTMTGTVNADWTSGRIGRGLSFDGRASNCQKVTLTGSGSDSFFQNFNGGPFTLSCWIKPNSAQGYMENQDILVLCYSSIDE